MYKYLTLIVIVLFAFASCKYEIGEIQAPVWSPEVLAPAASVSMGMEQLQTFEGLKYSFAAKADDIHLPAGTYSGLPTISLQSVGPFEFSLYEEIVDIKADSLNLELSLTNDFPFTIREGARIVFRNNSTGEAAFWYEFDEPITPGATATGNSTILNVILEAGFSVYIENAWTETVDQQIVIENSMKLSSEIELNFSGLERVRYKAGQTLDYTDTTEFEMGIGELDGLDFEGYLNIQINNALPMSGELQIYFLPQSQNFYLDSLFTQNSQIRLSEIASDGSVSQPGETWLSIPMDKDRLIALRSTKFIAFKAAFSSPLQPEILILDRESHIDFNLIADIKVTIE